jgi:hypothetical protein
MKLVCVALVLAGATAGAQAPRAAVPLPEHPRPDFERSEWVNLNGRWRFAFDQADAGISAEWPSAGLPGQREIVVPFSWGSALSGVPDSADIGWYARSIEVPAAWQGKRVFVVFGASDWRTTAWLDGTKIGEHQGGYTPFSFEITGLATRGTAQRLVVRVDDTNHAFKLEGKQGYGKARGMWQTVYLEARGSAPLDAVHFTPKSTLDGVEAEVRLLEPAPQDLTVRLAFTNRPTPNTATFSLKRGERRARQSVPLPNARRWTLEDPFLHSVTITVGCGDTGTVGCAATGFTEDRVQAYFGMRTLGVTTLPGTDIPYVALNGEPVYLQLALDQAYHPDGFYTFPTDSALRNEILMARQIGLNGLREHIKIETPRKLYWADQLGVLIMADVPNWWGPPDSAAFREHEYALRAMIDRDYNHPAVFSYVMFNETWGLHSQQQAQARAQYTNDTQRKVASVYRLAKSLDPTRLIEDNSICCGMGHTETDLNTWHDYLPGWRWQSHVKRLSDSTYVGSPFHFMPGYAQGRQPMLNSEFGNVWGYNGSTGDVDWSWDYRRAIDAFRRFPKVSGWLYTEHHDVINEWNGYWRFDRTGKETGLGDLVPGMSLRDLHSPVYLAVGDSMLSREVSAGAVVVVPLYASFLTGSTAHGDSLTVYADLYGWNAVGERKEYGAYRQRIPYRPWMSRALAPLSISAPNEPSVSVLAIRLEDDAGRVLHRTFASFVVPGAAPASGRTADGRRVRTVSVGATTPMDSRWSLKQWTVLDKKFNGTGSGYVEYRLAWPVGLSAREVAAATFLMEASAKRLNGKDRDTTRAQGDYMRGGGFHDRSANKNAYPMTSTVHRFPSAVTVRVNGAIAGRYELDDDPADSRGILSWHAQLFDGLLREAGSYGALVKVPLTTAMIADGERKGFLTVRLEVGEGLPGGLAVYGSRFGRYPVDPTVVFVLR